MKTRSFGVAAALLLLAGRAGADWPQFRGVNATGVSNDTNLPVHFGPGKNLVWRTPLPGGYSSPSVAGDRVFISALEDEIPMPRPRPRPPSPAGGCTCAPRRRSSASSGKGRNGQPADAGQAAPDRPR